METPSSFVEHDRDIMEAADLIVDIGQKAGINGGKIVSKGSFQELVNQIVSQVNI